MTTKTRYRVGTGANKEYPLCRIGNDRALLRSDHRAGLIISEQNTRSVQLSTATPIPHIGLERQRTRWRAGLTRIAASPHPDEKVRRPLWLKRKRRPPPARRSQRLPLARKLAASQPLRKSRVARKRSLSRRSSLRRCTRPLRPRSLERRQQEPVRPSSRRLSPSSRLRIRLLPRSPRLRPCAP